MLLEIEVIPPHAWDREVVERLLVPSCLVDSIAPETSSRRNLSSFKLSAWTPDPEAIPTLRWLTIPKPGPQPQMEVPAVLQYKVLIHLTEVTEFSLAEEPWFLGGSSSDSGQSGIPEEDEMVGGGGPVTQRRDWQFDVRDTRGFQVGSGSGVGGGGRQGGGAGHAQYQAAQDWRLTCMESPPRLPPPPP